MSPADGDGKCELVVGYTDRVVRAFRWEDLSEGSDHLLGQLVLLKKWLLEGQVGSSDSVAEACPCWGGAGSQDAVFPCVGGYSGIHAAALIALFFGSCSPIGCSSALGEGTCFTLLTGALGSLWLLCSQLSLLLLGGHRWTASP